jgi:hypothetical protein
LLLHPNEKIVKAAVFIASELGRKASPLVEEIVSLLRHSAMVVRYNAIDSLLTCTKDTDVEAIGAVVSLLCDTEGPVRRKAMDFLARASEAQIRAALQFVEKKKRSSVHSVGLRGLIGDAKWDANQAVSYMTGEDSVLKKYAAVAAARMDSQNPDPLVFGSTNHDEDVRCFAHNVLELRKV